MSEYTFDRIFAPVKAIKSVAETDGTPFYLYNKQGICESISMIHRAFTWMPGYQNYFLLRENNNPQILKLLAEAGTGVSACNYTELQLAGKCGFSGDQLLYEPTRKDPCAEALAKQLNAVWHINSKDLIPEDLPARMILRYHPSEERLSSVQFSAIGKSKNGISRTEIFAVLSDLHQRGVSQLGLSLQVASYSIHPGFWARKAEILLGLAEEVRENLGFSLWCLHIGEGPGLPYQPRATAPTVAEEAEKVQSLFSELTAEQPVLFTGINRQLMEHNGILITKILEERNVYNTFLVLDAGISHYLRPVLKQAYRHISVLGKNQTENRKLYFLVGELPDQIDRPAQKGRMLPKVAPGDYCVIHDVGCGARSMPMLFGCPCIAAEYLYDPNEGIQQIAPRKTEQEVLNFLTAL